MSQSFVNTQQILSVWGRVDTWLAAMATQNVAYVRICDRLCVHMVSSNLIENCQQKILENIKMQLIATV